MKGNDTVIARETSWSPPAPGFHKLNTDGAWKTSGKAAGGGVIRLPNGDWVTGFSTKYKAKSAQATELYAIRDGLMLAKRKKITKLEAETDAADLKVLIEHADDFPNHEMNVLIRDINRTLQGDWTVNFMHAPRSTNCLAHDLAAHAMTMSPSTKAYGFIPECARIAYEYDISQLGL